MMFLVFFFTLIACTTTPEEDAYNEARSMYIRDHPGEFLLKYTILGGALGGLLWDPTEEELRKAGYWPPKNETSNSKNNT